MRRFFGRFANLFRRGRAEREMTREIAAHLTLLQEKFERQGMTPEEAQRAARRAYGGVEQTKELFEKYGVEEFYTLIAAAGTQPARQETDLFAGLAG